jgi:cytoskeletal protein CcmA (bactofilin family)
MFDMGKKGTDKGQDSTSREVRQSGGSAAPDTAVRKSSASREAAVIGPSIHIDGDLRGEEDLVIEGEVNGTVQLKNNSLTIGTQGKVRADVYAHSIQVEGFMEGDLFGSERVDIRRSAQLRGNITSPRVSLEDGARFKGSIEMDPQAVEAALGTRRSTASPQSAAAQSPGGFKPGEPGKAEAAAGAKRG